MFCGEGGDVTMFSGAEAPINQGAIFLVARFENRRALRLHVFLPNKKGGPQKTGLGSHPPQNSTELFQWGSAGGFCGREDLPKNPHTERRTLNKTLNLGLGCHTGTILREIATGSHGTFKHPPSSYGSQVPLHTKLLQAPAILFLRSDLIFALAGKCKNKIGSKSSDWISKKDRWSLRAPNRILSFSNSLRKKICSVIADLICRGSRMGGFEKGGGSLQ